MIKPIQFIFILMSFLLAHAFAHAENINKQENKLTTVKLKFVTGEDILSVLETLIDKSVTINQENDHPYFAFFAPGSRRARPCL